MAGGSSWLHGKMGFLSLFNKRSSDKAKAKSQTANDASPPKSTAARSKST